MEKILWKNQDILPRLPVPDLTSTLRKYLRCLKTILSEEDYQRTKILIENFSRSLLSHQLQTMLFDRAKTIDNYVVGWWLDDMYLFNSLPLPINSNPAFILPRKSYTNQTDYLRFLSKFLSGILDYKILIDNRKLSIDYVNNQTLCMKQYENLFGCHRIPGKDRDELIKIPNRNDQHMIIAYRNHFFVLNVIENGKKRMNEEDIFCSLEEILRLTDDNGEGLGVLTSLSRPMWADIRNELINDEINRSSIHLIEQSICLVCLDQSSDINRISIAEQILHGGRDLVNGSNRWYDKTIQFIFGYDGVIGLNFEHSPAEGIVVIQLIEFLYKIKFKDENMCQTKDHPKIFAPYRLKWNLNRFVNDQICLAKENLRNAINDLDLYILKFTNYGRQLLKDYQFSPDAFIQLALQFTSYKIFNRLVSTYESASTRRFHLGRVDNIRANTPEALQWIKSMINPTETMSIFEQFRLFKIAIQVQTDLTIQNIFGRGMDCHLLALKRIAHENQLPIPDLFLDSSYALSNHFHLSTSQVTTNIPDSYFSYGAVVPDGYGCSYNLQMNSIIFSISSFHHCSTTNSRRFAERLEENLIEMKDLCRCFHPLKLLHHL